MTSRLTVLDVEQVLIDRLMKMKKINKYRSRKMKLYITKDFDGTAHAFYGKKPTFDENDGNGFWDIPLSEWDDSCGFDIITINRASYYSNVLTKMLKDIVERQKWDDEPFEVELSYDCVL